MSEHIFISYSRKDRKIVDRLRRALLTLGFPVWWDKKMAGGQTFPREIRRQIDSSGCVIVILSKYSRNSEWVEKEVDRGYQNSVLVPVLADNEFKPDTDLFLQMQGMHCDSIIGWRGSNSHEGFQSLIKSITKYVTPAPEPILPPEPPLNSFIDFVRGHWLLVSCVAVIAAVATIYAIMSEPLKMETIRIGVALKDGQSEESVGPTYEAFFNEVNRSLEQSREKNLIWKGQPLLDVKNIKYVSGTKRLMDAIKNDSVEIFGELSPYLAVNAKERYGAEPFVSPEYYGSRTYDAVFFVRRNSPYKDVMEASNLEDIITILADKTRGKKLATGNEQSTSGFWYPRAKILGFRMLDPNIGFRDISDQIEDNAKLLAAVENGTQQVIAGVTARFRLCPGANTTKCNHETLRVVGDIRGIPHGAFSMSRRLRDHFDRDPLNQVGVIQSAWKNAARLVNEAWTSTEKSPVPSMWEEMNSEKYMEVERVINVPDKEERIKARIKQLATLGAGIIVLVSGLAVWFRRPEL